MSGSECDGRFDGLGVAFAPLLTSVPQTVCIDVEGDNAHVVLVPVSMCHATERVAHVECRLTYTPNALSHPGALWFHEFSFSILIVDLSDSSPSYETQDRNQAKSYLPDVCRPLIMPIVVASLRALVGRVRPSVIYRVTKSRNPPERALRKHALLTHALQAEGYAVIQSGTDLLGRRFWLLKR